MLPCGSKIRLKSLYLLRFSRYSHFFIFLKNPRWLPKVEKIKIFPLLHKTLLYYPMGQKFTRNHSISNGFLRYSHFFIFHKNLRWLPKVLKIQFFHYCIVQSCNTLWVKNSLEITLSLMVFLRYSHFLIFRKNSRWPPKVLKIEFFPHCIGHSCTTLLVKNSLEIALSLTVCEIFVIFHIFTKSSNKVAITHLYIEQQL